MRILVKNFFVLLGILFSYYSLSATEMINDNKDLSGTYYFKLLSRCYSIDGTLSLNRISQECIQMREMKFKNDNTFLNFEYIRNNRPLKTDEELIGTKKISEFICFHLSNLELNLTLLPNERQDPLYIPQYASRIEWGGEDDFNMIDVRLVSWPKELPEIYVEFPYANVENEEDKSFIAQCFILRKIVMRNKYKK